jgi:hypothetical protein
MEVEKKKFGKGLTCSQVSQVCNVHSNDVDDILDFNTSIDMEDELDIDNEDVVEGKQKQKIYLLHNDVYFSSSSQLDSALENKNQFEEKNLLLNDKKKVVKGKFDYKKVLTDKNQSLFDINQYKIEPGIKIEPPPLSQLIEFSERIIFLFLFLFFFVIKNYQILHLPHFFSTVLMSEVQIISFYNFIKVLGI